jgi:hypothetical protein
MKSMLLKDCLILLQNWITKDKLEIQVLDDSDESIIDTKKIVDRLSSEGLDIN